MTVKQLYKVLKPGMEDPMSENIYQVGVWEICENFNDDVGSKDHFTGFLAVDLEGIGRFFTETCEIWECEVDGKSNEVDSFYRYYEKIRINRQCSFEEIKRKTEKRRQLSNEHFNAFKEPYFLDPALPWHSEVWEYDFDSSTRVLVYHDLCYPFGRKLNKYTPLEMLNKKGVWKALFALYMQKHPDYQYIYADERKKLTKFCGHHKENWETWLTAEEQQRYITAGEKFASAVHKQCLKVKKDHLDYEKYTKKIKKLFHAYWNLYINLIDKIWERKSPIFTKKLESVIRKVFMECPSKGVTDEKKL